VIQIIFVSLIIAFRWQITVFSAAFGYYWELADHCIDGMNAAAPGGTPSPADQSPV
jgi:hypothetical protein